MADRIDEAADRLYSLPLEDFVRERDAAAKALRAEKERDAAKQVGALAKPSAGAWAVNAIAREQPELRDELLAAGDALRDAQEDAVAGKGGEALREATARQRKAIDAILAAAGDLQPSGKPLSRAALDRLRQTLQAAAGDDAVRTAIELGRLIRDAESGGAWPFGGDDEPAEPKPRPRPRAATKDSDRDRDREERAAREREAAERRKEIEARLGEARAERRARERELVRAEREAERAAKRLDQAQEALDDARAAAEEAQSELTAATDAVAEARDHAARLEEQLD